MIVCLIIHCQWPSVVFPYAFPVYTRVVISTTRVNEEGPGPRQCMPSVIHVHVYTWYNSKSVSDISEYSSVYTHVNKEGPGPRQCMPCVILVERSV